MADFLGLMKQAAQLQTKMQEMQAELDRIEVEGTAGGGMVTVKLTAKGELKGVKIDDSLLKPQEKEIVEEMSRAARKSKYVDHQSGVSARFSIAKPGRPGDVHRPGERRGLPVHRSGTRSR